MLNREQSECIRACNECVVACLQCASACLKEGDVASMTRCNALALECADVCRLTASSVAWGSEHMNAVCSLCAAVCQTCASECAKHPMDHSGAALRRVNSARRCVAACRSGYGGARLTAYCFDVPHTARNASADVTPCFNNRPGL